MCWPESLRAIPGVTDRERELAARRVELLARSEALRAGIGARIKANRPVLIAGAAALVLLVGPRRALRLAGRALVVLGLIKRLLTPSGYAKP
jgi:hypothetical protein